MNFRSQKKYTTLMDSSKHDNALYFAIFNYSVASVAIVLNLLSLIALIRCQFRLRGYRIFLISLTAGDLYVSGLNLFGLVFQSAISTDQGFDFIDTYFNHRYLKCGDFLKTLQLTGHILTLLNLCCMNSDNLIGILLPHRYLSVFNKISSPLIVYTS